MTRSILCAHKYGVLMRIQTFSKFLDKPKSYVHKPDFYQIISIEFKNTIKSTVLCETLKHE